MHAVGLGRDLLTTAGAYFISYVLLSLIFQPLAWWPLALVGLVPWAVATCRASRAWVAHWLSFLGGWVFFAFNLSWLAPVTGLGYVALAFYLAIYWTLAAWALRTARRRGIAPVWALPVIWVACEYLRAFVMTGFPWLFIAHSFATVLPLIQISDITGAYGVTFVAAMVNGWIATLVLWRLRRQPGRMPRQIPIGAAATVVVLAATWLYGNWRLGQADAFAAGPRVAVVQEDYVLYSSPPHSDAPPEVIFARYLQLAAKAALEKPDLVVFPETVWASVQNKKFVLGEEPLIGGKALTANWAYGRWCHAIMEHFARGDYLGANERLAEYLPVNPLPELAGHPVTVVVGAKSIDLFPDELPEMKQYNSALVYNPDGSQRDERYDKIHLVPFGEVVPFRGGRFHWLYVQLNRLVPFSDGGTRHFSLTPGDEYTILDLELDEGRKYRFGTPICYEDVMPYVAREYVWGGGERRVDFLVNISNDGWFLRSAELPQHLAICVFRAVENRVGIARAVNTGISGFISPNGRQYSIVTDERGRRYGPGVAGYRVDDVLIDRRWSFYGVYGDWFARLCLLLTAILWVEGVIERWVWGIRLRLAAWTKRRRGQSDA